MSLKIMTVIFEITDSKHCFDLYPVYKSISSHFLDNLSRNLTRKLTPNEKQIINNFMEFLLAWLGGIYPETNLYDKIIELEKLDTTTHKQFCITFLNEFYPQNFGMFR